MEDGGSSAWASSAAELATYQKQGKIIVVGTMDLLHAGAPLALMGQ